MVVSREFAIFAEKEREEYGFHRPSCVRTLIDIGVRKVHYLEKATEEETRIVNEAAEAFIVHTKELIKILGVQDLSGEGIRNFVRKVFKH